MVSMMMIGIVMVAVFFVTILDKLIIKDIDINDLIFGLTVSFSIGIMCFLFVKLLEFIF